MVHQHTRRDGVAFTQAPHVRTTRAACGRCGSFGALVPPRRRLPDKCFGPHPTDARSLSGLATVRFSTHSGSKAITLTKHCPQKIQVLNITPCDTVWANIRAAAAANASRVCATRGAQSDAGCAASTAFPSPRRWKTVIRALKREVRIKFGPNVTAPAPSDNHGYLGYLTMHVTEYTHEARLLNAVLSKYNLSSDNAVHTLHNHPATTRLPTAQSWCSAVSNSSKYTRTALSALFLNGSRA